MRVRWVLALTVFLAVAMIASGSSWTPHTARGTSSPALPVAGAPSAGTALPTAHFSSGENASVVLGKGNFTSSRALANASGLCDPSSAAFDASGDLWVADSCNNRVVEFAPPFSNAMAASLVLGQPNFTGNGSRAGASGLAGPGALAFDGLGDLWVADRLNNRVLEFVPPFASGMAASVVLGQANFTSTAAPVSARSLALPGGLAFESSGGLWVADTLRNRVVEFLPPFTDFEPATAVLGQSNFTGSLPGTGPTGLSAPGGLAFDANGTLYVSDAGNNRLLSFPPPLASGGSALGVLGQTNLYSGGAGSGPGALDAPGGIAFDPRGALWVADTQNNRVLRFPLPTADGTPANVALGQPNLTANGGGTGAGALRGAGGITVDPVNGGAWVADSGNSRVLFFPGNAFAVATGTVTFSGGRGAVNDRATTGVQLNFSSVTGAASAVVVTQRLAEPPPGLSPTGFANTTYFAVTVSVPPGAFGVVQACFTVQPLQIYAQMFYWSGALWASAGSVVVNGHIVCGTVPMSALPGTPFAISIPGPSTLPAFSTLYLFGYATIGFIVIVAGLVFFNVRRQRRRAAEAPSAERGAPLRGGRPPGDGGRP